ncbi:Putative 149 kDa protein [Durusdinium trenchii]|uniref:149 kDa protein n=1 Tax=Durusdinium trenchii TaxID=1381693 RepID=A0ABP0LW00_9DINO
MAARRPATPVGAGTKRKVDQLEQDVQALHEAQSRQGSELALLRTRVDRIDKRTNLVVENSAGVEQVFKQAEDSRVFEHLEKDAAEALCQDLAQKLGLPFLIPVDKTADSWTQETGFASRALPPLWFALVPALLLGTRFILPNKLWSTRDQHTNQRIRASGHLVFKLEFGDLPSRSFAPSALGSVST